MSKPERKLNLYGSVASIIGLLVAFGVLFADRIAEKKALSVTVLSKGYLFRSALDTDFQLTYKGSPIKNVASFLVEFRNTGRQPIRPEDYEKSLVLSLQGVQQIISVRQVGAEPSGLEPKFIPGEADIEIRPTLLNPRDMFLLAVDAACEKPAAELTLSHARIAGIRWIQMQSASDRPTKLEPLKEPWIALILGMISSIVVSFTMYRWTSRRPTTPPTVQ